MSDSMKPSILKGSLILSFDAKNYKINDVITYYNIFENKPITHRISAIYYNKGDIKIITRGDNNSINDIQDINKKDILGKVLISIPMLGYVIYFAKTIPGLIILIIVPATIIIYKEILNIKNTSKKIKRKRATW